jgi:sugar phosphate isomerase/epimerase
MTSPLPSGLGFSSLAWEPSEDRDIALLLQSRQISFIDLVPTKYFAWDDPAALKKAKAIKKDWADFGIRIRGMQSLLFGAGTLNVLRSEDWPKLVMHFERVFSIASALGANRLVFGSPNNRKKGAMGTAEAGSRAVDFFRSLANQARDYSCVLLLEPNPVDYGCDFVTTTTEAISLVQKVSHENLMIQLDLGTCFYNNEQADDIFKSSAPSIGYIHLATKNLQALQEHPNPEIIRLLSVLPEGQPVSIEMKSEYELNNLNRVCGALDWLQRSICDSKLDSGR